MYKFCKVKDMAIDPVTATCHIGRASDSQFRYADICIYAEGIPNAKVLMNSTVLRVALHNSPELLKELGLQPIPKKAAPKATKPAAKAADVEEWN